MDGVAAFGEDGPDAPNGDAVFVAFEVEEGLAGSNAVVFELDHIADGVGDGAPAEADESLGIAKNGVVIRGEYDGARNAVIAEQTERGRRDFAFAGGRGERMFLGFKDRIGGDGEAPNAAAVRSRGEDVIVGVIDKIGDDSVGNIAGDVDPCAIAFRGPDAGVAAREDAMGFTGFNRQAVEDDVGEFTAVDVFPCIALVVGAKNMRIGGRDTVQGGGDGGGGADGEEDAPGIGGVNTDLGDDAAGNVGTGEAGGPGSAIIVGTEDVAVGGSDEDEIGVGGGELEGVNGGVV